MKKIELIEILTAKIEDEQRYIDQVKNDQNPQIKEMVNIAKGRVEAYEAVIYYAKTGGKAFF